MRLPVDDAVTSPHPDVPHLVWLHEPTDAGQVAQTGEDRGAVVAASAVAVGAAVSVAACITTVDYTIWAARPWLIALLALAAIVPAVVGLVWARRFNPRARVAVRAAAVADLGPMVAGDHPDLAQVHHLLWDNREELSTDHAASPWSASDGLLRAHLLMWGAREDFSRHARPPLAS